MINPFLISSSKIGSSLAIVITFGVSFANTISKSSSSGNTLLREPCLSTLAIRNDLFNPGRSIVSSKRCSCLSRCFLRSPSRLKTAEHARHLYWALGRGRLLVPGWYGANWLRLTLGRVSSSKDQFLYISRGYKISQNNHNLEHTKLLCDSS